MKMLLKMSFICITFFSQYVYAQQLRVLSHGEKTHYQGRDILCLSAQIEKTCFASKMQNEGLGIINFERDTFSARKAWPIIQMIKDLKNDGTCADIIMQSNRPVKIMKPGSTLRFLSAHFRCPAVDNPIEELASKRCKILTRQRDQHQFIRTPGGIIIYGGKPQLTQIKIKALASAEICDEAE
jgi:hypothetical protein